MSLQDARQNSKILWNDVKSTVSLLKKSSANNVSSQKERSTCESVANFWFDNLSKIICDYGIEHDIAEKYNTEFKHILKISDGINRRTTYLKHFNSIQSGFNEEIVIFLQTDAQEANAVDNQFSQEINSLLEKVSNPEENKYLSEALGCWQSGYLKAATVLLWCAAIDRIHKVIEKIGFNTFNNTSISMKQQTTGRFKKFSKEFHIQSISELRTIVFDNDLLWIIEGMQLIDSNERTRLVSCFDMRCHSGHPGDAPITKYNVLSCFSDIVEIIFANDKFSLS